MLNNLRVKSLKSFKATYVVRATITSPLPKDSPLRDGTVGYSFTEEYQQKLLSIRLKESQGLKGPAMAFSEDQEYREAMFKKEGMEFYDIFGNTGATKSDRDYIAKLRALIAPGGADKYLKEIDATHKDDASRQAARATLEEELKEKAAFVKRWDAAEQRREGAKKIIESLKTEKMVEGLQTPTEFQAKMRSELAEKIKEGYEMDSKLARRIRTM